MPEDRELVDRATATGADTQTLWGGFTIHDDKVMNVWRVQVGFGANDVVTIFAGSALALTTRTVKVIVGATNTTYVEESSDGKTPIMKIRPNTGVTPVQENQVRLQHTVGARTVQMVVSFDKD